MTTNDTTATIAVYGATGVTGAFLLTDLHHRGFSPILVGRDAGRMHQAASAAGLTGAEVRVAELADHAALVAAFTGTGAVISSLPTYIDGGSAVLAAAIEAGAHYTDMSGEQLFIERVFTDFADPAAAAGVTAIPGVSNSNLPGDLLAHVTSRRLPGAVEISMSLVNTSEGHGSKGSARTLLGSQQWFTSGGWHFEDGVLRTTGPVARHSTMTFPGATEPTAVSKFPQPPVLTVPRHSDVSYVEGVLDSAMHSQLGGLTAELVDGMPDEPTPGMSYDFVVDTYAADGRVVRGVLSGPDAYRDTALMAVDIAVRLTGNTTKAGALAVAEAFDAATVLDGLAGYGITWRIEDTR